MNRKLLCKKMWNDFEEAWISEIVCTDGTDPLCFKGGTPKCDSEHANRLFDGDENSVWPVSRFCRLVLVVRRTSSAFYGIARSRSLRESSSFTVFAL